jgi:hypothetical protein
VEISKREIEDVPLVESAPRYADTVVLPGGELADQAPIEASTS